MAAAHLDEDELEGQAYDRRLIRRLVGLLGPYRRQLAVALALLFGAALAELAPPYLLRLAIDGPLARRDIAGVVPLFAAYLLALVAAFACRYGQISIMNLVGQQIMADLRLRIFGHIQSLSLSFFDRTPVGRLLTRLTNDVDALNQFLTLGLVALIGDSARLVLIVVAMLLINWRLALIGLLTLPLVALATAVFQRVSRAAFRQLRRGLAAINTFLNEQLAGILVTQLFNHEQPSRTRFDALRQEYRAAQLRSLAAFVVFLPLVNFLAITSTALLLSLGGQTVLNGTATVGLVIAFIQYTELAFQPVYQIAENSSTLQAASAAAERMFRVLDTAAEIEDPPRPRSLPRPVRGAIAFDNVVFGYNPAQPVLHNLSFSIPPGQSVAVVGATGAGKTSLVSLLARFYDLQHGSITLDGVDIRELRQAELRRHIAAVPQDPVCFSGTIAANIRLHDESISDEQIRSAAALANAAPFIERLPGGYHHLVRERGANLSAGQRQLLAFARAIAFNPQVLLILDEATSSVDSETEALIQAGLRRLLRGRTSIVIAHRLSTIRHVDRIIVLHEGRVVEDGSHADLLARPGYYRRLYCAQFGAHAHDGAAERAVVGDDRHAG